MSRTDGKGGLAGVYHGSQTPFAGEAAPRQLEIGEVQREGSVLTFPFEETRFPEDSPDGCTYSYTGIYAFAPFIPGPDGSFSVFIAFEPPKGTFMITNIVVNGVTKAHSQGDAK